MAVPKKKNIKTKAKLLQSFYKKEKNKAYLNCILCYPDLMTMIFAISYTKTSEFEQKLKLETDPEKKKIIEQEWAQFKEQRLIRQKENKKWIQKGYINSKIIYNKVNFFWDKNWPDSKIALGNIFCETCRIFFFSRLIRSYVLLRSVPRENKIIYW